MSVTSPQGKKRALNYAKAKPAVSLGSVPMPSPSSGPDDEDTKRWMNDNKRRRSAIQDMRQKKLQNKYADPRNVSKFRRRHGFSS